MGISFQWKKIKLGKSEEWNGRKLGRWAAQEPVFINEGVPLWLGLSEILFNLKYLVLHEIPMSIAKCYRCLRMFFNWILWLGWWREASVSLGIFSITHSVCQFVVVAWLCPTLCDPMDYCLPGSSVHRILQARILEWVAISFSRGSSRPRDWTWVSCIAGRFFTSWATREVLVYHMAYLTHGILKWKVGQQY